MRFWVKEFKDLHLVKDTVVEDYTDRTRTQKVFHALSEACHEFDISVPIWLKINIEDFQRVAKTRFTQDSFIEHIEFDYLEFHAIEEDEEKA